MKDMNEGISDIRNANLRFSVAIYLAQGWYSSAAASSGKRMPVEQILDDAGGLLESAYELATLSAVRDRNAEVDNEPNPPKQGEQEPMPDNEQSQPVDNAVPVAAMPVWEPDTVQPAS